MVSSVFAKRISQRKLSVRRTEKFCGRGTIKQQCVHTAVCKGQQRPSRLCTYLLSANELEAAHRNVDQSIEHLVLLGEPEASSSGKHKSSTLRILSKWARYEPTVAANGGRSGPRVREGEKTSSAGFTRLHLLQPRTQGPSRFATCTSTTPGRRGENLTGRHPALRLAQVPQHQRVQHPWPGPSWPSCASCSSWDPSPCLDFLKRNSRPRDEKINRPRDGKINRLENLIGRGTEK